MRRFSLAFAALSLLSFAACSKKQNNATDTLRFRLYTDPPNLDWSLANDNVSREVIAPMHEGLVSSGPDANARPALAESWTLSKDGKTYTFTLRPNLKWNDGQDLVAQHFVDSWERLLNAKTASEYAYFVFDVVGAEDYNAGRLKDFSKVGVKALDAKTLEVKLRKPVAFWINIPLFWVTYPIRKDVIEKFGDRWTDPGNLVSAGAYKLVARDRDSRIVLEKNPLYWDQETLKEAPAKIEFRIIKDNATAVSLFNSGDLDIVRDLPLLQLRELQKKAEFLKTPYYRGYYVGFNVKENPGANGVKARRALAMAIDRDEIAKVIGVQGNPTNSWIPEGLLAFNKERGIKFDAVEAKKLWDSLSPKPTALELWFDQRELNKLVMENLQSQWRKTLGAEVGLNVQEWKVYLKNLRAKAPVIWRMGWGADYPDPDTFMNLFTCTSGNNFTGFCSKTYDDLISKAASSSNEQERFNAYDQAQKILLEDEIAIVPLFTENNMHLVAKRVNGFHSNSTGDITLKLVRIAK